MIVKKFLFVLSFMIIGILLVSSPSYANITVDGYLGDWGVYPAGYYYGSDWIPNNGAIYTVEDQNTYYLGPGYGGQECDAEAMYYKKEGNTIYLAIVTGMPYDNAPGGYHPGDIAINFDNDNNYEYGIDMLSQFSASLVENPRWSTGLYTESDPTTVMGGTGKVIGPVDFRYMHSYWDSTGKDPLNDHWVIEVGIPVSYFGDNWKNGGRFHWTQTCGNDAIDLCVPPIAVPEPASMSLLGLGFAGLLKLRRRKA